MGVFDKHTQPPHFAEDLAESRRTWLREHPAWMIGDGYIENLVNPIEWNQKIFAEFPGSFRLHVCRGNTDFPPWLGEIPGLTGLQLWNCEIDDTAFARLVHSIRGLRHFEFLTPAGLTDKGLRHIADFENLESLEIYCKEGQNFDVSFLAELSGENSPSALQMNSYQNLSEMDLTHIANWSRLKACSLSIAPDVRGDFPWLANLKNLRCLQLAGDGPLQREGLARLAELSELRELDIDLVLHGAAGLDALAKLEKLGTLSLRAKGGRHSDSHAICAALAQIKSIRNLKLYVESEVDSFFDITTNDLTNLAAIPSLETLSLWGECRQTPDFRALSGASHLKEIYHAHTAWPTDQVLAEIAKITGLTKLDVWVEDCTGQGLAALTALSHLTELELSGLEKQDESSLTFLADLQALAEVKLSFNGNSNLGMRSFSFLKNIRNLASLTIDERGEWNESMFDDIVAANGLKRLCLDSLWNLPGIWLKKLKQLPNLEEIELKHCLGFRDQDLACLAEVKTIRRLHLQWCDPITIKGVLCLRHLPLEKIIISQLRHLTPVSEQEYMALRLAWPEAIIE